MTATCETCRWWDGTTGAYLPKPCLRYPPAPGPYPTLPYAPLWPYTFKSDRCGEHQPKEPTP
jgi:hypothetical protein